MPKGRKKYVMDWETFDKLCYIQCTKQEIAWWFDISLSTIERQCKKHKKLPFCDYYEQKASAGRTSLRRKQYETAMGGNVTMQIFLGKQYLGQADKLDDYRQTFEPVIIKLESKEKEYRILDKNDVAALPAPEKEECPT